MSLSDSAWMQNISSVAPCQHFSENGLFHSITICLASSFFVFLYFFLVSLQHRVRPFMVFKKDGSFLVAIPAIHAKTTTDAPLAAHFGCSLEIGSCLLAQLRSYISSSMRPMSLPCWKIQPNLVSV